MAQQNKSKLEAENQGLKEEIERLKALQSHPSFNQFLNQDHKTAWCLVDNELIVQSCSSSFQSLTGISPHTLIHSPFDLTSIIPPEKKPDYLHFILALKKHQHSPKILLDLKNATPLYIQAFNKKDQTLISFQKAASLDIKPDTPTKKNNPAATEDLQQLTEEYYAINKELKKTEKYLYLNQYSIEHSNNAIYWFGPTGRFHYVNQQACEMLEYTKEELLEKHAYDISNINPETWAQSWEKLRNAKRLTSEFLHITKSGKQIPVEISANYFIYEGQEYVFSVATDISERKKTEEKLIKSEKNYRSLFEQAVDGILMGDDKGVIIDANESICQMSGYNKAELKGNKINILFSEEELNNNPLRYDLLQEGREVKKERKLKAKKDHSDKIIEMNTKRLSDGRLQAFIRDVSEKKKAEETMMQASDIFNHIQTGLLIYQLKDLNDDRTLIMVNANPACEKLLGVHPDEMIGKTIDQNFPHLRAKGIPQRFAEVIRFQELYEVEDLTYEDERVLKKAFSFKGFPLPNQQIGVAFENISEKKIVEEAMAYQRSFEQLITQTSSQFIHIPYQKIDISIEASIGMLCRQMKASAGYLLNVDDQQEIMQMTHCWQNKELDINQELFQSIQKKDYPHLFETLLSGEVIAVETNHDINKQNKTITSLNFIPGNKTFLKIPIIHKQKLIAVLGFASIEENKKWKEVERDLLEMAGQIFINALQRKQSEEALFESERSYREIFNSPTDAIFILDAYKGDIIDLNKGALEMLGTDKKHAQNIFVQSHLKEGAYSIEQMKKFIIKTREVGDMRFEWFAEFNDTPTWSEVSLKYAQINGQERILAVARDITKRKNAEKKLEDTNNFLEGIVNTSYNVIYVRDIQRDKLIFVSKRIKDITQYTVEECLELDHVLSHFVHEEDYPTAENHVKNLMKTKADEQIESELRIRRKDKQIRWMHVTSTIFSRNEEGYPVHSMAVLTDITNRKKAEEALRISQQRLKLSL
ncbi:MAG: PAS domain S-box protein, partial [Bacteroidota bacterium]